MSVYKPNPLKTDLQHTYPMPEVTATATVAATAIATTATALPAPFFKTELILEQASCQEISSHGGMNAVNIGGHFAVEIPKCGDDALVRLDFRSSRVAKVR